MLTIPLIEAGAAEGFYFGLRTMATTNAMFSRVAKYYQHRLMFNDLPLQQRVPRTHGAKLVQISNISKI